MAWMADNVELRTDVRALVPGARSVICVADRYDGSPDDAPANNGRIARYARGRDYHKVMKKRLHAMCDTLAEQWPEHTFRACVDTAPVLERDWAQLAGLGSVGKNTMLIEPSIGSWLLLGEIITTLDIEASNAAPDDPCGTCTRCIDACPTQAISPWAVDATRCVSYLTIEHRDVVDPSLHEGMGAWIFGCDVCQEVCPHNQPTSRTVQADREASAGTRSASLPLLDVLQWTEQDRVAAIAGTSATRAKLDMWRRNAAIALGNTPQGPAHREALSVIDQDSAQPPMVSDAVRASLHRQG